MTKGGFTAVPIKLTFEGNYYDLTDFLFRLRNLVIVRDGELEAAGRCTHSTSSTCTRATEGFPQMQATMTVSAYSYGAHRRRRRCAYRDDGPGDDHDDRDDNRRHHDRAGPRRGRRSDNGSGRLAMSKKGEEILRKRKEAKQKKLLFVLGPIFLLLMVWQGPGYLKMLTGGSAEPTAVTSTPTATGATPDPGSAAPPSTAVLDPSAVPAAPPAAGALAP